MYRIGDLSAKAGVTTKTIRYYEEVGLLPEPVRAPNGYRLYTEADIERLQFIRRARMLNFALDDIAEILAFRERGEPPCRAVMTTMRAQIEVIEQRVSALLQVRDELQALVAAGEELPEDVQMRDCVCHLIRSGSTQQEGPSHEY